MNRLKIALAALLGCLAVICGAYGAHGLKLPPQDSHYLEMWKTAVQYHLVHVLGLLFVGSHKQGFWLPYLLFLLGIVFFSGSLYILVLTKSFFWAKFTPFGGMAFILGWLGLSIESLFRKISN
ncbi:DUF423 domain-containing protein [Candidatus Methylacidiphilum infernorum]|uniref:Uncharacterized small membrane protein n=1 Tax=Methylacidiphilum infernorum (isolate V4) TaxID=481448 RepID=B3DX27_METI4|nr:DUF423 domain-containing protein [Candidatus Methylacidiphilum infernorum]ACD82167.1 Uncharacterized small membrane protein [Methylacidiphilum infernorum V4]